jgi:hypothetical protein
MEVKKMAKKRIRGQGEYNIPKTWEIHRDGISALERMEKLYKSFYRKKHLVTFGLLVLERELKAKGVKPGDDIEETLGIQADQTGSRRQVRQTPAETA